VRIQSISGWGASAPMSDPAKGKEGLTEEPGPQNVKKRKKKKWRMDSPTERSKGKGWEKQAYLPELPRHSRREASGSRRLQSAIKEGGAERGGKEKF